MTGPLLHTLKELWAFRYILGQFCLRDIKGRFIGSYAGVTWVVIVPLSQIAIYYFLFSVVLKVKLPERAAGTDSFLIFFMCGLLPWLAFSEGVSRATSSLRDNANLIQKVVFAKEVVPCSAVLSSFVLNMTGFLLYMIFLAWKGFMSPLWLLFPGAVVSFFFFSLGLSYILAALNVFFRDTIQIVQIALMVWFYFTPILYPIQMVPERWQQVMKANPLYWYTTLFQQLLLSGTSDPLYWGVSLGCAIASMLAGSWLFYYLRDSFADFL